jgi:methylmalonyl-CoA mutase N-terminal domain/subunit
MDPNGYQRQVERLNKVRQERDNALVQRKLQALRTAAENDENTMPYIIEAVRAYATLGEMTDIFRDVFGTYIEPTWI